MNKTMIAARKASGLSLIELEKLSGVSRVNICRWEREAGWPRLDLCIAVCDVLGISLDEYAGRMLPGGASMRLIDANNIEELEKLPYEYEPVPDGSAWYRAKDVWNCIDNAANKLMGGKEHDTQLV